VLGSPVAHSLSPVLHAAAYTALGLEGWTYDRVECDAERLPEFVAGLGPEWAGLSVTMPGKRAALATAKERTPRADVVGAANTLVPLEHGGWRADCTDVDGVVGALRTAGGFTSGTRGVVLGAGGTASAALVGLASLGVTTVDVVVRDPARATEAVECAERAGLDVTVRRFEACDVGALAESADVLVSTVPAAAAAELAEDLARAPSLLDVIYHPWPTPVAGAVRRTGSHLATGLDMLLHQAFGQVEQFTGLPAPREAMREALSRATA
jgi:shikimate dehydrogenase